MLCGTKVCQDRMVMTFWPFALLRDFTDLFRFLLPAVGLTYLVRKFLDLFGFPKFDKFPFILK